MVKFDAEGYEYIIVFDWRETHIISNNSDVGFNYASVKVDIKTLAEELVNDIRNDLNEWVDFAYRDLSDKERESLTNEFLRLCDLIERRIKNVHT